MTDWIVDEKHTNILEPSAGDGVFIDSLMESAKIIDVAIKITAVELEKKAFESLTTRNGIKAVHADFHTFESPPIDAAIGNPPFVRFRHLSKTHLDAAEFSGRNILGKELDISGSIWLSIILHSIQSIKINGKIAYVIPSDAVYVRYARPFWKYICDHFGAVKVVRCSERLFPEILQDVVLLFADSYGESTTNVVCEDYQTFEDMTLGHATGINFIPIDEIVSGDKPFMKVHLSESERLWLHGIQSRCHKAIDYAKFNIGYVSGNKKFFHPSDQIIEEFRLPKRSLKDAVVTARKLSSSSFLTSELTSGIEKVWLPDNKNLSSGEKEYIKYGEEMTFDSGHKTGGRSPWFEIPGVVIPDIMLTVFGELPRLLINDGLLPASNSILIGRFKAPFPAEEFLMLWYSSITRLGIELSVHSLGGGVLVMVPREGDSVMMPKPLGKKVPIALLGKLRKHLELNDIQSAYQVGDEYLLRNGWHSEDIETAKKLATQFMARRKKTS
jgi:adenine-specific DNA-methyltransferase